MSLQVLKLMIEAACKDGPPNAAERASLLAKAKSLDMAEQELNFLINMQLKSGQAEEEESSGFEVADSSGFEVNESAKTPHNQDLTTNSATSLPFTDIADLSWQGKMARVQKARLHGKWVVIKRLKPRFVVDPQYKKLFDQEFENAYHLDHPNIVRTLGRGEDEQGPFYYMEFIDGQPLSKLLKQAPLPAVRAKHIFTQLIEALDYVHKKQIVHRDLKPDNILITFKGDTVKILDFGLAMASGYEDDLLKVGTPKYAAPEQTATGNQVGPSADLYSAGLIYLEMLSGKLTPTKLPSGIDSITRQVLERSLKKDPDRRFQNAWEVLELMRSENSAFSTSPPPKPAPPPPVEKKVAPPPVHQPKTEAPKAKASEDAEAPPQPSKKRKWKALVLILVILGLGAAAIWFGSDLFSEPGDRMYVIASNLYVRNAPLDGAKTKEMLPYGYAVNAEATDKSGWVSFMHRGEKRYLPSKYLGNAQEYYEIDAIYGNSEARDLLQGSPIKRALRSYFISHNLKGDLTTREERKFYGEVTNKPVWQVYALARMNKFNAVCSGKFTRGKKNDIAVIISKKQDQKRDRRLLVFSFDKSETGHLQTTLDLRDYKGYFIKTVTKSGDLSTFSYRTRNKVSKRNPGILLGKNRGRYTPYLYLYENGNFQIYEGGTVRR